jgi:hypothetical protein
MPKKRNRKMRGASHSRVKTSPSSSWAWLDALSAPLDPDMVEAALEQLAEQDRPDLDKLFPT